MTTALLAVGQASRGDVVADRIDWRTDTGRVRLVAAPLAITTRDRVFTASDAAVTVHGDPGDPGYWTLEAEWREQGAPMRLSIYFTSDGKDWWAGLSPAVGYSCCGRVDRNARLWGASNPPARGDG